MNNAVINSYTCNSWGENSGQHVPSRIARRYQMPRSKSAQMFSKVFTPVHSPAGSVRVFCSTSSLTFGKVIFLHFHQTSRYKNLIFSYFSLYWWLMSLNIFSDAYEPSFFSSCKSQILLHSNINICYMCYNVIFIYVM